MIFPNAAQTYPIGNHLFTKPWTKSIKTEPRTAHIVWLYDLKTTKKVKAPIDCRLPFHHKPSTQPHLDQIPLWSWYLVLFATLQFAYMQTYIYTEFYFFYITNILAKDSLAMCCWLYYTESSQLFQTVWRTIQKSSSSKTWNLSLTWTETTSRWEAWRSPNNPWWENLRFRQFGNVLSRPTMFHLASA